MRRQIITIALLAFSVIETYMALSSSELSGGAGVPSGAGNASIWLFSFFREYSVQLSITGWALVGLNVFRNLKGGRSAVRNLFESRGLSSEVYDLMIKTRGGDSRFALLHSLDTPRHRFELSGITGIDWKEVDRQVSVLTKYGLVALYAQSGVVKLYQITEQGKLLLRIIEELGCRPTSRIRDQIIGA